MSNIAERAATARDEMFSASPIRVEGEWGPVFFRRITAQQAIIIGAAKTSAEQIMLGIYHRALDESGGRAFKSMGWAEFLIKIDYEQCVSYAIDLGIAERERENEQGSAADLAKNS